MATRNGKRTALIAVSRPGSAIALRLQRGLPDADVFLPTRIPFEESPIEESPTAYHWSGQLGDLLQRLFREYANIVVFGSVGMTVRLIAPAIESKHSDPAVVVVDDVGRFAVSVLSGHIGGGNALARRVALELGAQPVITTASEVLDTIAVDLLGMEFGWRIEGAEHVTRVSAAIVNGETVGLIQEAGEQDWWPGDKPLPANVVRFDDLDGLADRDCQAALVISDRTLAARREGMPPVVIYRPHSLVVGIGCNRGTAAEEIAEAVDSALTSTGLVSAGIRNLATIEVKRDEPGLNAFARRLGVPITYFSAQELEQLPTIPNPSVTVKRWVGTPGVCEPAALLSSGAKQLLVAKHKTKNVTVAVARVDFSAARGEQRWNRGEGNSTSSG